MSDPVRQSVATANRIRPALRLIPPLSDEFFVYGGADMERWVCPVGACIKFLEGTEKNTKGKWLVTNIRRGIFSAEGTISLAKPTPPKKEPASEAGKKAGHGAPYALDVEGGAKAIVDQAVEIAKQATNNKSYVASDYRAGGVVASGNPSDHSENSSRRAARDIAIPGIDALHGPPSPLLDDACVEIGKAFGRTYRKGQTVDADTFIWHGYRIQIIWRTPKYGGHMGHIHVGAYWPKGTKPGSAVPAYATRPGGDPAPSAGVKTATPHTSPSKVPIQSVEDSEKGGKDVP